MFRPPDDMDGVYYMLPITITVPGFFCPFCRDIRSLSVLVYLSMILALNL